MAGESGGGYICSGAMVHLAIKDEAKLVKLAIPIIPMLDDYEFTSKESMTKEEAENALGMTLIWKAIAGPDFESKRSDPMLFPGKASEQLLSKMPPTVMWESEFDFYITPATRWNLAQLHRSHILSFTLYSLIYTPCPLDLTPST